MKDFLIFDILTKTSKMKRHNYAYNLGSLEKVSPN